MYFYFCLKLCTLILLLQLASGPRATLVAHVLDFVIMLLESGGHDPHAPAFALLCEDVLRTELLGLVTLAYTLLFTPRAAGQPLATTAKMVLTRVLKAVNTFASASVVTVHTLLALPVLQQQLCRVMRHVLHESTALDCTPLVAQTVILVGLTAFFLLHKNQTGLPILNMSTGYFAVQQPAFQDALHAGLRTPMVTLLCGLPFEFFNSPMFDALFS